MSQLYGTFRHLIAFLIAAIFGIPSLAQSGSHKDSFDVNKLEPYSGPSISAFNNLFILVPIFFAVFIIGLIIYYIKRKKKAA